MNAHCNVLLHSCQLNLHPQTQLDLQSGVLHNEVGGQVCTAERGEEYEGCCEGTSESEFGRFQKAPKDCKDGNCHLWVFLCNTSLTILYGLLVCRTFVRPDDMLASCHFIWYPLGTKSPVHHWALYSHWGQICCMNKLVRAGKPLRLSMSTSSSFGPLTPTSDSSKPQSSSHSDPSYIFTYCTTNPRRCFITIIRSLIMYFQNVMNIMLFVFFFCVCFNWRYLKLR